MPRLNSSRRKACTDRSGEALAGCAESPLALPVPEGGPGECRLCAALTGRCGSGLRGLLMDQGGARGSRVPEAIYLVLVGAQGQME